MSTDNFDFHLKKNINKLLIEKKWFFYKDITKKTYGIPFKLSYREKLAGVDDRYDFYTDLTIKEFTSIYERKPNWVIDISPTTVFSYLVDNNNLKYTDELFKNYAHFTTFKNCFSTLNKRQDKNLAKIFFKTANDSIHPSNLRTIEEEKQVLNLAKNLFNKDELYDALHGYLSNNSSQYSNFFNAQALQFVLKEFVNKSFSPKEVDTFKKYYPNLNQNNNNLEEEIFLDISHKSLSIYLDQKAFYNKIEIPNCEPEKLPDIYSSIMSSVISYLKTEMKHFGILDCSQVFGNNLGIPNKKDIVHLLIIHNKNKYLTDKEIKQFIFKSAFQLGQNYEILKNEDKKQLFLKNFLKIEFNDSLEKLLSSKEINKKPLKI